MAKNKHFDVVIGNPPYQDPNNSARNNKLWHQFVLKSQQLVKTGGHIKLLTPKSILSDTGFGKKMLASFSTQYDLTSIDYTVSKYFSVGVDICYWQLTKQPYGGLTLVTHDCGAFDHNLNNGLPLNREQRLIQSILDKIDMSDHDRIPLVMGQDIAKDQYTEQGKYEVYASGKNIKRTDVVPTTPDCLKLVVPFSSSHTNRFTTTGHIGMLNCWCPVEDMNQAEQFMSIIDHPVIDFFIRHYKRTSGFTPAIKNARIPIIDDLSTVEEQFGLTDEELQLV